jgi:hypothetical protein
MMFFSFLRESLTKCLSVIVRASPLTGLSPSPSGRAPLLKASHRKADASCAEGRRCLTSLPVAVAASLLSGLLWGSATAAETGTPSSKEPAAPTLATAKLSPEEAAKQKAWHESLSQAPLPKKGCYEASYPDTQWREVLCKPVPLKPYLPTRGSRPDTVGDANDVSAQAPTGHISSATGSFDSANVTSEATVSSVNNCSVPSVPGNANTFSLQLNANTSATTPPAAACNGGSAKCVAWQQFVYTSNGSSLGSFVMQYWLINYGTETNQTCPAAGPSPAGGWTFYDNVNTCTSPPKHQYDCYGNGPSTAQPNAISSISELGQMSLIATASGGAAGQDTLKLFLSGIQAAGISNDDNIVNLEQFWTATEFNVFGDCCGDQANFNSGATIVPRTKVIYGGTASPVCWATGFTGETNNLSFGPTPPAVSPPGPAVFFTESSAGGATSICAAATTVGDTHLTTFDGLKYDFQATGEFLLAQSGDLTVQTRQAPAVTNPAWIKNATINKAVGTRMGETRVAICLDPARLEVDGKPHELEDGKSLSLPEGARVSRTGNVYAIISPSGDSVSATLNNDNINTWIDVSVGLSRGPGTNARGLLGSQSDALVERNGTILRNVSFTELYHRYADSWRVAEKETLLCSEPKAVNGIPERSFYASDLDQDAFQHARSTCTAAGIKNETLLEDCILDTAVLGGGETAAKVFVRARAPVHVIKPVSEVRR